MLANTRWKIGDEVAFLNTTGGGVVTQVLGVNQVMVRTDDGFEMEMAGSTLVNRTRRKDQAIYKVSEHDVKLVAANDRMEERKKRDQKIGGPPQKPSKGTMREEVGTVEIDLHLHELVKTERGMSDGEKLQYQLNYFERMLNNAIRERKRRMIVIHGVGEGVLREEVRKLLQYYEGLRFDDADPRRYGYGATEVLLQH